MDLNLIKKLVKILDTSGVTDIEIEENGFRVKIAKKIRAAQETGYPQILTNTVIPEPSAAQTTPEPAQSEKEKQPNNLHEIKSPIVGTFYRAPAPDADPYVQVGDYVTTGTVLCIVEAMKLMNEIETDITGKILKILVENGRPVEYNQPLFLIEAS
ncbi:MAG TPA: acetyl-CoA carboxylase biotin carboxyl carrier protein [Ignavibacteriaceae bacterium]|nr:acetyl-CoA carboxylase biotin carboxyl carrier protein [Ignavibacteriaceae bacterium]